MIDGRDVTPFPLDDLRMVYAEVRYSKRLGKEKHYAPLRTALDLARHALLSHPTLARVAVAGRVIGDNDFWIRILNSGLSISAADLIGGLMARAAELSGDRFRTAARDLNAFLSPVEDGEAAGVLGNLDEGCDAIVLGFDRPNIRLAVEMKRDWKGQLRDFVARHDVAPTDRQPWNPAPDSSTRSAFTNR